MLDLIKGAIAILVSFYNLLIALLVLFRNPRKLINIIFFVIATAFSFWALSLFFYEFPLILSSFFWIKSTYLFATVYIGLVFSFSFIFPEEAFRRAWAPAFLALSAFFGLSVWLLFFTNFWVVDVIKNPVAGGIQTILGPAYKWWVIFGWLLMGWMIINFVIKTRRASQAQKFQMLYFWIGFAVFAFGVCSVDVVLPLISGDTRFFIYSTLASLFFTGATAYAIIKHHFMDIRQIISRSVAYFFLIITIGFIYTFGLFSFFTFVTKELISSSSLVFSVLFVIFISISFQPFLALIEKATDRFFYKGKYDSNKLLYDLTLIMASTLRLSDITRGLLNKILQTMHIRRGAFILLDQKRIFQLVSAGYASQPEFSEEDLDFFTSQSQVAVFDELPETPLKEMMRRLEIRLIVPLRAKAEFEDVLVLGGKLSGEPYNIKDIELLEIFASEAAIAIVNASSFERLLRLDELKSEFITVVSHQLRTPLSAARWNFELLLEEAFGHLPENVVNVIKDIYQALMTLNKGLNNLMSVLEIEEGKMIIRPEAVEINRDIIEEAIGGLAGEIQGKNIIIKRRFSVKKTIFVDRQKMLRVFDILIDNAIRYSPIGSTVTLTTAWHREGGREGLLVSVEDEGIGVPAANREFIVQKFFRGDQAKKISPSGFGLSLFAARNYIEFYGGRLWVEGKEGPGSVFRFYLPVEEEPLTDGRKRIRLISLKPGNSGLKRWGSE